MPLYSSSSSNEKGSGNLTLCSVKGIINYSATAEDLQVLDYKLEVLLLEFSTA